METKYKVGDAVIINDKDWTVDEIIMKFGRVWVYGLTHEDTDGIRDIFTIEKGTRLFQICSPDLSPLKVKLPPKQLVPVPLELILPEDVMLPFISTLATSALAL